MSKTTEDMDLGGVVPRVITTRDELTAAVAEAAQIKLIIVAAEARQQTAVEAAREAFELATRADVTALGELVAGIEAAAAAHKDDWFPVGKGGKRKKTMAVLTHSLAYRASSEVTVPEGTGKVATQILVETLGRLEGVDLTEDEIQELVELRMVLERVIREPDPEISKPAVKALPEEVRTKHLEPLGIEVKATESFTLNFNFSPNA